MEKPVANQFTTILGQIRRGELLDECSEKISQAVAALRLTGKRASITLKLDLVPLTRGCVDSINIDARVSAKLPEPEKKAAVFFTDENNGLHRNDPRQAEFENLKVVEGGQQEKPAKVVNQ